MISLSIAGAEDVVAAFARLADKAQTTIAKNALQQAVTEIVLPAARRNCPVRGTHMTGDELDSARARGLRAPGALRASLQTVTVADRRGVFAAVTTGGTNESAMYMGERFYGAFVEFGHKMGKRPGKAKMGAGKDARASVPAHPFLRPALYDNEARIMAKIAERVGSGIEGAAGAGAT